jgi:hypothetical protein
MKYATWKLDFTNALYGIGPEDSIANQGGSAEASWVAGQAHQGGTILGYFIGSPLDLENFEFTEITSEDALAFAQQINATAFFENDGRISAIKETTE